MSAHLEQNGLYILPKALGATDYLVLRAEQHSAGWRLVENHDAPGGSDRFRARAGLSSEHMYVFAVSVSGELEQLTPQDNQGRHSLANLSLLGYLRDGRFVEPSTD